MIREASIERARERDPTRETPYMRETARVQERAGGTADRSFPVRDHD